jgi:lipoprotein-releasing system permease protein
LQALIFIRKFAINYINLNFEFFISRRFLKENKKKFSQTALNLSVLSIALGLAVMILSVSIVTGFQESIRNKIAAFEGHIQVSQYDYNNSMELPPIYRNTETESLIKNHDGIKSISSFAYKGGIIKSNGIIQGCVFKGVDKGYDWDSFKDWIIAGEKLALNDSTRSNDVIISKSIADKMGIGINDNFIVYFMQEPPRVRKFKAIALYESGFPDFDNKFILGDLKQIQRLNKWEKNQIAGYEIMLNDFGEMDKQTEWIYNEIDYNLKALNLNQRYPFIMDWLNLLDTNVYFILGLMIIISGIGMVATLLILILEKTRFIGSLKAMGATNSSIRKIFIYHSIYLSIRGLFLGNVIGIGLAAAQKYYKLIPLDASTYYMNAIPINLNLVHILLLNIGVLFIISLIMWAPSHIISRITPVKALRYE